MATILIFSENRQIAHKLCDSLIKGKYEAKLCSDQNDLRRSAQEDVPLIVLDASMRWTSARPLLEMGQEMGCPLLFLTEDKTMRSHLQALYRGPSEVAVLPLGQKKLAEHIAKLMGDAVQPREISVDEAAQEAVLSGGRRVELTAQEMALLLTLMQSPDSPVSRERLLREAWGYQSMGETRTVDVHVQRLRKKLGCEYIETVYKCGYRLKLA
jgi:DNA-binding response OmpR family regulator